jgi:hypothetical protein
VDGIIKLENKTPLQSRGEMKRIAETEDDAIVEIPLVVRIRPIRIEPPIATIVTIDHEHVRVAIGVGSVCRASSIPLPFECSQG